MLILDTKAIANLLSFQQIIAAVEEAMVACETNSVVVPKRMHLDYGKNTILCMPS
jgi:ornithine cyclodeaminase